jgi:hypothetical protein
MYVFYNSLRLTSKWRKRYVVEKRRKTLYEPELIVGESYRFLLVKYLFIDIPSGSIGKEGW